MKSPRNYVLVLGRQSDDLLGLESLLKRLRCSVAIASSEAQAMDQVSQDPPYLVILAGNHQNWSQALVHRLRNLGKASSITIVALTDSHTPSWLTQEENPGFDGFLVKPISGDILSSLIHSARARQTYSVS
jgi:CheY-like chemotaxis protein